MTRLIYIPDESSLILLDSPLNADALVESVKKGLWNPPGTTAENPPGRLQAVALGGTVVISTSRWQKTPPRAWHSRKPGLPHRQRQVLQGLAEGLTTTQIAARLHIHPRTVEHHINAIKIRLGAANRVEIAFKASALGLIHQDEE